MNTDPFIEEYIRYLGNERGLSANTQQAYRRDLFQFFDHCSKKSNNWPSCSKEVVLSFLVELQSKKKDSSRARALMALKGFFRFLFKEEYISIDLGTFFKTPKIWQTLPHTMGYPDIERILSQPDIMIPEGIRDRAILELLYGTGIRVSELVSLQIYDVHDAHIKVHGKGGKERLVPLGKKALDWIDRYLSCVRDTWESKDNTALFIGPRGKSIDRIFIWKRIKEYAARAGLSDAISPHTFRHTYASHLLDAGADVRVIQELLGHAHISSTDRYTHMNMNQIREVFHAFHPRWVDPTAKKELK